MFYGVIFLQAISIVILFCELLYIFSKWSSKRHSFLLMMILAALVNNVGYLVEIISDNMEKSLFGTKLSKVYPMSRTFSFLFFQNFPTYIPG